MSATQVISQNMFDERYGDPFAFLFDPDLCPSPPKRRRTASSDSSRSSMSSHYCYYYSPPCSDFNFSPPFPPQTAPSEEPYPLFVPPLLDPLLPSQLFDESTTFLSQPQPECYFQQQLESQQWMQPTTSPAMTHSCTEAIADGFVQHDYYLPPSGMSPMPVHPPFVDQIDAVRTTRAQSLASNVSTAHSRGYTRAPSPSAEEMSKWGTRNNDGTWSCAHPGCTSRSTFHRGCDLRKHFKRHTKSLFCRHEGCPQSTEAGFSSKKDRSRHEAKHNPGIVCEWVGCDRLFSRQDNMKDHVRRVHRRRSS